LILWIPGQSIAQLKQVCRSIGVDVGQLSSVRHGVLPKLKNSPALLPRSHQQSRLTEIVISHVVFDQSEHVMIILFISAWQTL
jgi:hypothetical protein